MCVDDVEMYRKPRRLTILFAVPASMVKPMPTATKGLQILRLSLRLQVDSYRHLANIVQTKCYSRQLMGLPIAGGYNY